MLPLIPRPSSLAWCPESLLGFKTANLPDGGSYVGCLPTLIGTAKPARANSPEVNGKIAFQKAGKKPEKVSRTLPVTPRFLRSTPTVPG